MTQTPHHQLPLAITKPIAPHHSSPVLPSSVVPAPEIGQPVAWHTWTRPLRAPRPSMALWRSLGCLASLLLTSEAQDRVHPDCLQGLQQRAACRSPRAAWFRHPHPFALGEQGREAGGHRAYNPAIGGCEQALAPVCPGRSNNFLSEQRCLEFCLGSSKRSKTNPPEPRPWIQARVPAGG